MLFKAFSEKKIPTSGKMFADNKKPTQKHKQTSEIHEKLTRFPLDLHLISFNLRGNFMLKLIIGLFSGKFQTWEISRGNNSREFIMNSIEMNWNFISLCSIKHSKFVFLCEIFQTSLKIEKVMAIKWISSFKLRSTPLVSLLLFSLHLITQLNLNLLSWCMQ